MNRGRKVIYRAIGYITFGSFIVMMLQTSMRKKLWYDLLAALLIFIGIFFVTKTFVDDDEESDMNKSEYERQFEKAAEESSINNDASLVVALIGIVFLLILKLLKII